MRRPLPLALAAAAVALAPVTAARAADPVLPLGAVKAGMQCTALTVIRGTDITSFNVEVLDVLAGSSPRILVRASGPAVDETGVAQGFSGSPVLCPGPDGTPATIGAVSEGTGDYGNKLVLVTPIETMLGDRPEPPARTASPARTRAIMARARPLTAPLTVAGVSGAVASALQKAARDAGRPLLVGPARPRAVPAPAGAALRPGAAVSVGLSSGAISAGAVGTVTYVDGDAVWAFGHPLDNAGRRALLLQEAYVYTVVGNPLSTEESVPYKLAAPGASVGTLTNDTPDGVVGRLGPLPGRIPLRINARDLDSGRVISQQIDLADESPVGLPTGASSVSQITPIAVAQTAQDILRGSPSDQSGSMCMRIVVAGRKEPMRFCNTYVGGSPSSPGAPLAADAQEATALLDSARLGRLRVQSVDVNLRLRRQLRQAYLLRASGPSQARRGQTISVRLSARRSRGEALARTVKVRIPSDLPIGETSLMLRGAAADVEGGDSGGGNDLSSVLTLSLDDEGDTEGQGPSTLSGLAAAIAAIHRETGVTASFSDPGADEEGEGTKPVVVLRDQGLRLSGTARLTLDIKR